MSFRNHQIALWAAASLGGCSFYHALPLDDHPKPASAVEDIRVDTRTLPFPFLAKYPFDPSDGLDMTEVAILAVVNNPDLRLARDDLHIARAQSFAAGLLPDPQFSMTRDVPHPSLPGTTTAYNQTLTYDFGTLVSHWASSSAAEYDARKTDLNLLWQEWQVVAQARVLFSRRLNQQQQLSWLRQNRDFLAERYGKAKAALEAGNLTIDVANTTLASWQDAARQVNDLERQQLQTRHELNALLGLAETAELRLVESDPLPVPDEAAVRRVLNDLPRRRPDLLALKAGYAAEDARYRQAILAQFPPFNLGISRARDTADVTTRGMTLSLALPLLNGNRGNVRIEEATRRRLHDEYELRVNTARQEVERLMADGRLIAEQLQTSAAALPALDKAFEAATRALAQGNLDGAGFAALQSARTAKHIEVTALRLSLLESQVGLLTVLGGDFASEFGPPVHSENRQ